MKRGLKLGLFLAVVLISLWCVASVSATDYYVDATNGDNGNLGTSPEQAWETISKVNSMSFSPGDSILFKRGEEWYEKLTVPSSGSEGKPITFGTYGNGNNPVIDGSSAATGWIAAGHNNLYKKTFSNYPTIVVEDGTRLDYVLWDTDIATTYQYMQAGTWTRDKDNKIAYVWSTDDKDPDTHAMRVSTRAYANYGILIEDKSYVTIENIIVRFTGRYGIKVKGYDDSNIIIQNCIVHGMGGTGITMHDGNTADGHNTIDSLIDNCIVYNTMSHGIAIATGMKNTIVSNNVVHDASLNINPGAHGITMWSSYETNGPDGTIVEYNEVYNIRLDPDNYLEGTGIQSDDNSKNSIVRYNYCHDNEGKGFVHNTKVGGSTWYYNIGANNGYHGILILNHKSNGTVTIENNVFYNNGQQGIFLKPSSTGTKVVKNNILAENNGEIKVGNGAHSSFTSDYNCVYHSSGGKFMNWRDTSYDWADWKTQSGQDANSINSDPLFVDAANGNFHLQSTSPCIDAGIDVGLTQDFEGNSVPQGNAPDIGAYEYAGEKIECYQDSDCGTDPCRVYTCNNPGTTSASCSFQDITSCINNDGCCPTGCNEGNDNDCGGLIALYHFNEGSGTTTFDSSGYGNDGTVYGATWTTGISRNALEFDGTDDYVDCGNDGSLNFGTGDFTISLWVKTSGGSEAWSGIIHKGGTTSGEGYQPAYSFSKVTNTDNYFFQVGNWVDRAYFGALEDGDWHHLVGVVDSGTTKVYLDGGYLDSDDATNPDHTNPLRIARGVLDRYFNGTIDEVRIYNRALTPKEILEHYNQGTGNYRITFSCSPISVTTGQTITCLCSATDNFDLSSIVSYTVNPSTSSTGTYTTTCTALDDFGNSVTSSSINYTVSSPGDGGNGDGGGIVIPTIQEVYSGLDIHPEIPRIIKEINKETGIKQIQIETYTQVENVKITVTKYNGNPTNVSVLKTGKIYRYLQIEAENLGDKLNKSVITIQVKKNWTSENNVERDDIAMFRFNESYEVWNELETVYTEDDETYYYYDVELDSFSYFAIVAKGIGIRDIIKSYWLWVVVALVIIVIVIIILIIMYKHKRRRQLIFQS